MVIRTTLPLKFFTQTNFVADYLTKIKFYSQKRQIRYLSHSLEDLGERTYALLWLAGKPVVDFLFLIVELISLTLMVETL